MNEFSTSSVLAALLKHKQEFAEIYAAGNAFLGTTDISDRFSFAAQIVAALGPIAEDLVQSQGAIGAAVDELAAASTEEHATACAAAGLDWSVVEKIVPLIINLLPLLLA